MALYQIIGFDGNLTRKPYGSLNNGIMRLGKSHSVNPFVNSGVLSFNETPTNLDPTHATVADLIVSMASNIESGTLFEYAVDRSGNVYKINTTTNAISLLTSSLSITLKYGGGLKIVESGTLQYLVIAHDNGALYCLLTGASPVAITNSGLTWTTNMPHPISDEFAGDIYFGNGFQLVQWSIASLAVINNSVLNPSAPVNYTMNSLAVDSEGRYLRISITSQSNFPDIITTDPTNAQQTPLSRTLYWNGIDPTYDSFDPFNQSNNSSTISFTGSDINFGGDWYGSAIYSNDQGTVSKPLAMPFIRPPTQGALTSSGELMFFGAPYLVQGVWKCGIFHFGTLDDQDQPGIGCDLAIPATANNTICTQVGALALVQNYTSKSDGTVLSYSKFYVSTYETGGTAKANLYALTLTPGGGAPIGGIYETQKEKMTLPQQIKRVLFAMQPSTAGVSFKLDLIDSDDTIPTGGSVTYAYAAGADPTQLQGSLDNFEWTPQMKNVVALGARITNLGTVQPNIIAIYIETEDTDKSATSPSATP